MEAKKVVYLCLLLNFVNISYCQNSTAPESSTLLPTNGPSSNNQPSGQQTATEIERNTDLASCTCDLTANACDVNCCCDPECDDSDRNAFSQCIDFYTPADDQLCLQSNLILLNNAPFVINDTVAGLFCIQVDNYVKRNFYDIPDVINNTPEFDDYLEQYGGYSYKRQSPQEDEDEDYYKSGDPILTVFETDAVGYLGLPSMLTTGNCKDTNPAAFLLNENNECGRPIENLATECTSNVMLNAETYYKYFRLLSTPSAFQESNITIGDTTTVAPTTASSTQFPTTPPIDVDDTLYNSEFSINITADGPHICLDADDTNNTCFDGALPVAPEWIAADEICSNVVVGVSYLILHNGTDGIRQASVTFTFRNLTQSDLIGLPIRQSFGATYRKDTESADDIFKRAGNPGYLAGEPLLAGKLNDYTDPVSEDILYGIEVDTDRNNWLTMLTSTVTGECEGLNNRVPVKFDEAMTSGCKISVSRSDLTNLCTIIRENATTAFWPVGSPTHVATFGNSDVDIVGDWVEILSDDESSSSPGDIEGECSEVPTGMHIEVIYANVGNIANPQPKILGVYRRIYREKLKFQCIGPYCQPGMDDMTQSFYLTSSVGFIDATQKAVGEAAQKPTVTARLPEDFFYPFT